MATIRKRKRAKKDVWIADYEDAEGRRHRLTAPTKEAATKLLAANIQEREGPQRLLGDPATTLEQYATGWLSRLETLGGIKPRTIESYRYLYRLHVAPALGAMKLRELHRIHVKTLLQAKREAGLSANSVRLVRSCLSVMLAEAKEDALIEDNVAAMPSRRRGRKGVGTVSAAERQKAMRPFTDAELDRVLDAAARRDPEYFPLFFLLARTGERPGEALAHVWSDFDFTHRKILVERAISAGVVGSTKTDQVRFCDMSGELAAALSALYRKREAQALARGWGEVPELVFINSVGNALDLSRTRKRFGRAMRLSGVSGHRLYDLRHTVATQLLAAGAPITFRRQPTGARQAFDHAAVVRAVVAAGRRQLHRPAGPWWHQFGTDFRSGPFRRGRVRRKSLIFQREFWWAVGDSNSGPAD
jgi:integrase